MCVGGRDEGRGDEGRGSNRECVCMCVVGSGEEMRGGGAIKRVCVHVCGGEWRGDEGRGSNKESVDACVWWGRGRVRISDVLSLWGGIAIFRSNIQ